MTPLRIALVESSPLLRARLKEAFAVIPDLAVVGTAETESEARSMLATVDWDVVVLDLQLREGTGIGVLRMLAATPREAGQVIIVATHFTFPQYRKIAEELGAGYFFDKAREYYRVRDVLAQLAQERGQDTP